MASYIHSGHRIGVLVEVVCQTEVAARTDELRALAHDLAPQVAAFNPTRLGDAGSASSSTRLSDALLEQPFIRDAQRTVQDLLDEASAKLGERVEVRRFVRFALDDDLTS